MSSVNDRGARVSGRSSNVAFWTYSVTRLPGRRHQGAILRASLSDILATTLNGCSNTRAIPVTSVIRSVNFLAREILRQAVAEFQPLRRHVRLPGSARTRWVHASVLQ